MSRSYATPAGNLIFVVSSDKINQWPYSRHGNISNNLSTSICSVQHVGRPSCLLQSDCIIQQKTLHHNEERDLLTNLQDWVAVQKDKSVCTILWLRQFSQHVHLPVENKIIYMTVCYFRCSFFHSIMDQILSTLIATEQFAFSVPTLHNEQLATWAFPVFLAMHKISL